MTGIVFEIGCLSAARQAIKLALIPAFSPREKENHLPSLCIPSQWSDSSI
jgi:hypothetical protein